MMRLFSATVVTALILGSYSSTCFGQRKGNIELDSPDLIASIDVSGGKREIIAYKDVQNDTALTAKSGGALRWFSTGFPQPVRLGTPSSAYKLDEINRTLILYVSLLNNTQKEALAKSATAKYGTQVEGTISADNVFLVPLQYFEVSIESQAGEQLRIFKGTAQSTTQTLLNILFRVESDEDLRFLADAVDKGVFARYRFAFMGQEVKENRLQITAEQLKDLGIEQNLKGDGAAGYVTRDQLTRLSGIAYGQLDVREEYEIDGEVFSQAFIEELVKQILQTEFKPTDFDAAFQSLAKFGFPSVLRDLTPDEVKSEMSKAFNVEKMGTLSHIVANREIYDEGKKKFSTSGKFQGAVSALELFSASSDIQFALAKEDEWKKSNKSLDDQLKELSQHSESNVEWAFDGTKVIPKSVRVASLANANFSSRLVINRVRTITSTAEIGGGEQFHTKFDLMVSSSPDREDFILAELENLRSPLPPVGAILPYFGDEKAIPKSWTLCDGKVLDQSAGLEETDVAPFLWKRRIPNLAGRLLRGLSQGEAVGNEGGSDAIAAHSTQEDGVHTHSFDDPVRGLTGVTSPISRSGGWANPGRYTVLNPFGQDRDGEDFIVTEGDNGRNEHDRGKGQHRHTLDDNGKAKSAGTISTKPSEGSHKHAIDAIGFVPSYIAVRYVMRIR